MIDTPRLTPKVFVEILRAKAERWRKHARSIVDTSAQQTLNTLAHELDQEAAERERKHDLSDTEGI